MRIQQVESMALANDHFLLGGGEVRDEMARACLRMLGACTDQVARCQSVAWERKIYLHRLYLKMSANDRWWNVTFTQTVGAELGHTYYNTDMNWASGYMLDGN